MFRVNESIKRFLTRTLASKWVLIPVGAAALSIPAIAHADPRGGAWRDDRDSRWERRDYDRHDYDRRRSGTNIDVDIRLGGDRRPEYRTREVRVWVPPVYKTVVDRKWVEPVYRTECERVWVPPVYEDREVQFIGGHGRLRTRIDRVLVCDGHFENRERRVCVSEGRWETCERQELVCEGHYDTRIERVREPYRVDPLVVVNPGLGGLWHR